MMKVHLLILIALLSFCASSTFAQGGAPGVACGGLPGVTVEVTPQNALPGEIITVTIHNNSGQDILLPNGCAYQGVYAGTGCQGSPLFLQLCTLNIPTIPDGGTYSRTWDQQINGSQAPVGNYSFEIRYFDANFANNYSCCVSFNIDSPLPNQCGGLPGVAVSVQPPNPMPGELITVTIDNNSGQEIWLPNGCAFQNVYAGGFCQGNPLFLQICTLNIPSIPDGGSYQGVWNQQAGGNQVPDGDYSFEIRYAEVNFANSYSCCVPVTIGGGPGTSMCFGDGGDQMGCTECPCGNNAQPGSATGCINSSLSGAFLEVSGSESVTAPDPTDLRFELFDAVPNSFSVLVSGAGLAPTNPQNPCFGLGSGVQSVALDGLRCAVQNTLRHGGRPVDANGQVGQTNNGWGGASGPPAGIAGQSGFGAGTTRYFQVFYREFAGVVCNTEQNTSQAIEVVFTP